MDQGGSVDIPGSWHSRASNCHRFGSSGRGQWSTSNPGHNEPTYKDYWEVPGGSVEADESPYATVVRELKEELGIAVQPGRLLVTDWVPPRPGSDRGFDDGVRRRGSHFGAGGADSGAGG
ncbi:NUDIX domain-containing protein [Actinoplanes solisilvae]|uniref:NUDIX domain-containing protein n=1 Tax=Actinoplanes solisilvae TaxID=2486853 RepID=UPI001F0BD4C4|nr:NUDIX domain-containing protein [Actinoplanes solisilvae]